MNVEKKRNKRARKQKKQARKHRHGDGLISNDMDNIGTAEDMDRFSRRTVKVTKEHNEECRRLLGLMGIPFVVVSLG